MFLHTVFPIEPLTDAILHRIPAVEKAEIRQMINGPESFTTDGHAILGEAPGVSISMGYRSLEVRGVPQAQLKS